MNICGHDRDKIAAIDENGSSFTYGELSAVAKGLSEAIPARSLVFSFCSNTIGSLVGYIGFLFGRQVPLMLDGAMDAGLSDEMIEVYRPSYIWAPEEKSGSWQYPEIHSSHGYKLLATGFGPAGLYDGLALLLATSGSTGSPKLVRQSYANLSSNAESIADYLEIDESERAITSLPMNYVYGLSVINSHFLKGATMLLTTKGVMQRGFWDFFKREEATSIAGVPYTYEMLKRLRFFQMELPSLRTLTQAGGKLMPELQREFAEYAESAGKRFYVMYGAAEATSRMGYLPFDKALEKNGSMGIAIPGGEFRLVGEDGKEIDEAGAVGELVYRGENVTLGYATCLGDLAKGDENGGVLFTGDMAKRDEDGFYYIVGRKKRFLKIFGNRIGLDETEQMIKSQFGIECACAGKDNEMAVFITQKDIAKEVKHFLAEKTKQNPVAFKIFEIDSIPKNESGKTQYSKLESYYE